MAETALTVAIWLGLALNWWYMQILDEKIREFRRLETKYETIIRFVCEPVEKMATVLLEKAAKEAALKKEGTLK